MDIYKNLIEYIAKSYSNNTNNVEIKENLFKDIYLKEEINSIEKFQQEAKAFIKIFNEVTSVAIQGYEPDGTVIFWNKASEDLYGYLKEEALSKNLTNLIIPDSLKDDYTNKIEEMFESASTLIPSEEIEMKHKDGTLIPVYSNRVVVKLENGNQQLFCLDIDMRNQKAAERQLYIEKELLKATLLSVGDGFISTDFEGRIVLMNRASEKLTGWSKEEAYGKFLGEVFHLKNQHTKERIQNPVYKVLANGENIKLTNDNILITKDVTEKSIENSAAPIIDKDGKITGSVIIFRDFTEKKNQREKIKKLTFVDQLTNLYNRRYFEAELNRLDAKRNLPITIIIGDINGLKLINDSFGHEVGDEILISAAKIVKESCREDDIIARIGGDECAILVTHGDGSDAEGIIKRIKERSKIEIVKGVELSISFGFATKEKNNENIDDIFKKAEDNMYNNKLFEGPSIRGRAIDNIVDAINSKSPREKQHSERVSEICVKIGESLGFEEYKLKELKAFGLFHDIGKIAISDSVLNKPGPLNKNESREMNRHSEIGYRILSVASGMSNIAEYVLAHHERWDGTGYPRGLKGEEIPLPSRICMIADVYDAVTSKRSYHSAMPLGYAVEQLKKHSGTQFDKNLVDVFVEKVQPYL